MFRNTSNGFLFRMIFPYFSPNLLAEYTLTLTRVVVGWDMIGHLHLRPSGARLGSGDPESDTLSPSRIVSSATVTPRRSWCS